jgi:hypothetical protein
MSAINHPGEKYLEALVLYGHSKNVLSGNTFELRRFTEELETGKLRSLYESQEFRDKIFSMNGHLLRYIHNFLSSHMTYVEHVRSLMRSEIIRPAHYERYDEKIKTTFASEPIVQFTQHLRNYVVHKGLPSAAHVSYPGSAEPNMTVYIELDKIPDWQKWKEPARLFYRTHQPHLRLQWFMQEHEKLMTEFNRWFALEFYNEYRPEIEDFEKHHQKLFAERFKTPDWVSNDNQKRE